MRTIEPMRLTIRVPVAGVVTEKWARGRMLMTTEQLPLIAMVHGMRRVRKLDHGGRQYMFMALAYIQVGYRREIPERDRVTDEYAWVECLYAMNCSLKSVAAYAIETLDAFRESNDYQWLAADAPTPATRGDAA
ncbi:hypothetical protein [Caballeronia sp. LZ032]|uniref:hypothetical protein n=1 Tax=Caballeronia sp. LZ032 TaxID=3038565 RepID=UPI002862CECF|nr:hypothetical protein [Caballeronia sp. LZ032]MDR5881102.1 hypothetical protein [Caballeronia sp. LZ032]